MNIVRYDPWKLLNNVQRDLAHLFDGRFDGRLSGSESEEVSTPEWMPAVDIKEEKDHYVILADVPGVDPKNIEINAENGMLSLKGERRHTSTQERDTFRRVERVRGTFFRRFHLPDAADTERIKARSNHGVLEIVIPKTEVTQPRRIKVEN